MLLLRSIPSLLSIIWLYQGNRSSVFSEIWGSLPCRWGRSVRIFNKMPRKRVAPTCWEVITCNKTGGIQIRWQLFYIKLYKAAHLHYTRVIFLCRDSMGPQSAWFSANPGQIFYPLGRKKQLFFHSFFGVFQSSD